MIGRSRLLSVLAVLAAASIVPVRGQQPESARQDPLLFRSRVDFVSVNATVTDASGRFVVGLRKEDFSVYEDGEPVDVTEFSVERVPVSLGIALDTSGSMSGDKIKAARRALERLLELVDRSTEIFLFRFGDFPILVQGWTTDRRLIGRGLERITPSGNTAMYDAVAAAIALTDSGRHQKKVLLIVSDGHDTISNTSEGDLKRHIRESDALVYAIGIDGAGASVNRPVTPSQPRRPPRFPIPLLPGVGTRGQSWQVLPGGLFLDGDRVDLGALRGMTDDSGGRTEIVRETRGLNSAVTGIVDELGRQYFLGYTSPRKKDGQWHAIRVDVADGARHVRARRGYVG